MKTRPLDSCLSALTQRFIYVSEYAKLTLNNPVCFWLFCAKYEEDPKISQNELLFGVLGYFGFSFDYLGLF